MAAINVTPMADVIITLLIIFMVMTPMFGQDDHVRLPAAENAGRRHGEEELLLRVRDACREAGTRELVLVARPRELRP